MSITEGSTSLRGFSVPVNYHLFFGILSVSHWIKVGYFSSRLCLALDLLAKQTQYDSKNSEQL